MKYELRSATYGRGYRANSLRWVRQELRASVGPDWVLVERRTGRTVATQADARDDRLWALIVEKESPLKGS